MKGKDKSNAKKQLREERLYPLDHERPIHVEKHAYSKHDLNKKGRGKGRPRSPTPTGPPHRNSKGGDDWDVLKIYRKFLVKVRQGKQTDNAVQTSRKESVQRRIHVMIGMFLNGQFSNLPVDADSETMCTQTHINLLTKREMQLRQIQSGGKTQFQSGGKTQFRVRLRHFANRYVLKKGEIGTWTWSHADRIQKSAKSVRSYLSYLRRKDLSNGQTSRFIF